MTESSLLNVAAVAALVPASLLFRRRAAVPDGLFWTLLVLAAAGPALWAWAQQAGQWNVALTAVLWVGIAAGMVAFVIVALLDRQAWRLTVLMAPYALFLAAIASLLPLLPEQVVAEPQPDLWLALHIVISVAALALLTPAAVAALSSILQARALKRKRPTALTRMLPPLMDSDRLLERLLIAVEAVLALGVLSGMASEYTLSGSPFVFSHKALFSLLAFLAIGLLLVGRRVCGVRGQMAARVVLLAYLLVIAGYFGMKFVHQVLLG